MTQRRDCLWFVADSAMANVVDGFLSEGHLEGRLGCRSFRFDFDQDLIEAPRFGKGADGGIYGHCHRLLQENGYLNSHQRLIVMLDQEFGGERPAVEVRQEILERLQLNGWSDGRADVVVIDPELEVWVWQDNPHVQAAVGFSGTGSLRQALNNDAEWPEGLGKPLQPKTLFRQVCRRYRTTYNSSLYRDIVEKVSVKNCTDSAFQQLIATLCRWFPIGGEA